MCVVYTFCPFSFAPHFPLHGQSLHCAGVLRYVRLPFPTGRCMSQYPALRAAVGIICGVVGVIPWLISILLSGVPCVWKNRNFAILYGFLCDPRCLVACVHGYELNLEFSCYIVIYIVPRYAVMDISCGHLYAQYKAVFVTDRMCFIGKLPLMLSFYEHSAVWVCSGNRLFYRSSALGMIFVVFNGLLVFPFPR